jgi:hypothetical protein
VEGVEAAVPDLIELTLKSAQSSEQHNYINAQPASQPKRKRRGSREDPLSMDAVGGVES